MLFAYLLVGLVLAMWFVFLPLPWQKKTALVMLTPIWPVLAAIFIPRALEIYHLRKLGP